MLERYPFALALPQLLGFSLMDPRLQANLGDRYRIERALASGGMGTVYEGIDIKLNRRVAIKMIQGQASQNPEHLERFRIEADATARLQHPHIVQVLDIGLSSPPFMVLESLVGMNLHERLKIDRVLSPPRACIIGAQVLSALSAAHQAGVVHRDIKPANIFLVDTPPPGVIAKVLDFGVARLMHQDRITYAGDTVGTMPYMSPEQHQGAAVDGRSDLFSLGIVLYQMLAGNRPFVGATPEIALAQLMTGQPPPPIPNCPPELDAIVRKSLALHPGSRFATADEMGHALAIYLPRVTQMPNVNVSQSPPSHPRSFTSPPTTANGPPTGTAATGVGGASVAAPGARGDATGAAHAARAPMAQGNQGTVSLQASAPIAAQTVPTTKPSRAGLFIGLGLASVALASVGAGVLLHQRSDEVIAPATSTTPSLSAASTSEVLSPLSTTISTTNASIQPRTGALLSSTPAKSAPTASASLTVDPKLDAGSSKIALDAGAKPSSAPSGDMVGAACKQGEQTLPGTECGPDNKLHCGYMYTDCSGYCHDLHNEHSNCGGCGKACASTEICQGTHCLSCPNNSWYQTCDGRCVGITSSSRCGGCGISCGSREKCARQTGGKYRCVKR